jgi:hypothetical protein
MAASASAAARDRLLLGVVSTGSDPDDVTTGDDGADLVSRSIASL